MKNEEAPKQLEEVRRTHGEVSYIYLVITPHGLADGQWTLSIPPGISYVVFDIAAGSDETFAGSPFVRIDDEPLPAYTTTMPVNPKRMVVQFTNFTQTSEALNRIQFNIYVLGAEKELQAIDPVVVFEPDSGVGSGGGPG